VVYKDRRDTQVGFAITESAQLISPACWLLIAGSLELYQERTAEEYEAQADDMVGCTEPVANMHGFDVIRLTMFGGGVGTLVAIPDKSDDGGTQAEGPIEPPGNEVTWRIWISSYLRSSNG
jgi:hypothetical protein